MNSLFDDVSRVIGSPVSRRKMLSLVGSAVGGAMFASLGLRATAFGAQTPENTAKCGPHQKACGKNCCDPDRVCVEGICCPPGQTNCNGKCCGGTCTDGVCCGKESHYCGGACCPDGIVCCNGKCCGSKSSVCFNGKCCLSGIICNGVCCQPNEICCDGKRCVDKHISPDRC